VATKIENETAAMQSPVATANSLAPAARPSEPGANYLTRESGPSAPHREASNGTPIPVDEDDLLGEDLVDYRASPEHLRIDVNVITFLADYTINGDDELAVAQFDFSPKDVVFTKPKGSVNHCHTRI
jgi:hypothetical protein